MFPVEFNIVYEDFSKNPYPTLSNLRKTAPISSNLIFQRYGNNHMSDANGFDDLSKREELNVDY